MTLNQIEKFFFLATIGGLFIPLSVNLGFIILYVWNIPALGLIPVLMVRIFVKNKGKIRRFDLWDFSILGFIIILLLFTLTGANLMTNFPLYMQYVTGLLMALYVRKAWERVITPKMVACIAIVAILIQSVTGIIQQITFSQFGNMTAYFGAKQSSHLKASFEVSISRIMGTLGQPNVVANWIITFFPFAYIAPYLKGFKSNNMWLIKRITVILGAITVFLTISRGSIAFFILLCITFSIPWGKRVWQLKWTSGKFLNRFVFLGILIVMGGIYIGVNFSEISSYYTVLEERIEGLTTATATTSRQTADFRMEMNEGAIQKITAHPIVGLGFQNSKYIWDSVDTEIPGWWTYRPHNVYLAIAVEGGVLAFLFFVIYTCLPIYYLLRRGHPEGVLRYAFLFALTAGFLFSQVYLTTLAPSYAVLYAIILGCSMGYIDEYPKVKK